MLGDRLIVEGVHGGCRIGKKNVNASTLLEFCNEMELCMANTQFEKEEQRKITHSMHGNGTD